MTEFTFCYLEEGMRRLCRKVMLEHKRTDFQMQLGCKRVWLWLLPLISTPGTDASCFSLFGGFARRFCSKNQL